MKKTKVLALILALVLTAGCLAACGGGNAPGTTASGGTEKRSIRIAIQPSCAFIPLYIARQTGWMDEAMKEIGVDVVWTDFESGPPMNESFVAGQQDIGVIGDVPAVTAVANGQKNVYIAAEEGGSFTAILVLEDSGINSVADLKGKKVGVVIGSTGQNMLQKALASGGLDFGKDIEAVNVSMGEAQTVLINRNVDAVVVWEPNVSRIDAVDGVKNLIAGDAVGFGGVNIVFARKEFVDSNPDIVKVFLAQYWKATKAFKEKPEDYTAKIGEVFNLDEALLKEASSKCIYTLEFTDSVTESLQDTVSFLMGIEAIKNEINVRDFIVDDLAREVVKENP
ncbi:MAG: aliphatic sulfonate ABC transporter substrate-binding protein [Lachnospiraceae bacterium]|nr:aliphatic sulfonate ABC transporter substrate-binding protein [Lachnospiraceae bacterium]